LCEAEYLAVTSDPQERTAVLQAGVSSFLIFGGIVFLIIGLRMILTGSPELTPYRVAMRAGSPAPCRCLA
jgi:hypothetical protein